MSNKTVYGIVAGLVATIMVMGAVSLVVGYLVTRNSDGYVPEGLEYSRETYVSACTYWAKQEPESKELGDAFIKSYCGCIYDDGVKQYGKQQFMSMDDELNQTGVFTPEINQLINICVTKVFNEGSM